ncbi:MAG: sigma-70 family RNA polymerase sigma factor [Kineosporiaceae bacterium]
MTHTTDAADWGAVLEGDGEAFGRLFDAHRDRVHRLALRLTGDVHDAQDVVAAAFLELWRRRRDVRLVEDGVRPWLLATATNVALNRGRGLRRHRAFLARLPRAEPRSPSAEGEALAALDLDVDPRLLSAIGRLGAVDQRLLALVALEGYPLRDAARALGLTEAAARSRWQRTRRRLAADSLVRPDPASSPDLAVQP